jgi:hypothetical protein
LLLGFQDIINQNAKEGEIQAAALRKCSVSRRTIHLTWVLQRPMQMFSFLQR